MQLVPANPWSGGTLSRPGGTNVRTGASLLSSGEPFDGCGDRAPTSGGLHARTGPTPDRPGAVDVSLAASLVLSNSLTLGIVGPLGPSFPSGRPVGAPPLCSGAPPATPTRSLGGLATDRSGPSELTS